MRRTALCDWAMIGLWGGYLGLAAVGLIAGCNAATRQTSQAHATAPQHVSPSAPHAIHAAPAETRVTARQAWDRLREGNARFVNGRPEHPDQSTMRRLAVAKGQHPYAVVLTCSDSRVPPEILFDSGIGDIFVIRVAGNTADNAAIGSMEYAVEHLHVPLIVVLGHERCGAVQAAVKAVESRERAPGHLGAILNPIVPAVTAVHGLGGDSVEKAIRENVLRVTSQLKTSKPILAEAVHANHLAVVGAVYDLDTGRVEIVPSQGAVAAH